ncbi:MAG: biopolymer transporter ExbD [Gammaproteobacteria bacterium]|nr:biopolymer transporter ExbD [Gammaproteobacteria bacterium]
MTPMIDCVFQLLLFFMLVSQFREYEDSTNDLNMPSASAAAPLIADSETLFIDINREGHYFVRSRQVMPEELRGEIHRLAIDNRLTAKVGIRADATTPFQFVVAVVGMCQAEGINDYQTVTRQEVPRE